MKNWGDYVNEWFIFIATIFVGIVAYLGRTVLTNDRRINVLEKEIKTEIENQKEIREVQEKNMGRRQDELLAAVIKLQDILNDLKK